MDLPLLLAAVERGDDAAVIDLLDDATADELAGDDAVTLLAAAANAGLHEVVDELVHYVDGSRPWSDGADPVTWAEPLAARTGPRGPSCTPAKTR